MLSYPVTTLFGGSNAVMIIIVVTDGVITVYLVTSGMCGPDGPPSGASQPLVQTVWTVLSNDEGTVGQCKHAPEGDGLA